MSIQRRPLFGCLCHWPPPPQEPTDSCSSNQLIHAENVSTVKEVLAAFLQQGAANPLIFANAAMVRLESVQSNHLLLIDLFFI